MRKSTRFTIFLICVLLIGAVTVTAQGNATPITVGQNITGQLGDAATPAIYVIQVGAPQSIKVQVLAITPGFAPALQIVDPSGVVVLDNSNPGAQTIVQGSPNLSSSGQYQIVVKSANNVAGQFLLSVQPGAPLAPPQALTPGQPVNGSVDPQTTRQAYSFAGSPSDVLLLTVSGNTPNAGPVVALRDADSGDTLGLISPRLGGVRFRIPTGQGNYLVEVLDSSGSAQETFVVCLGTESNTAPCPGSGGSQQAVVPPPIQTQEIVAAPTLPPTFSPPVATPTFSPVVIDPNGSCQVATARAQSVNVRSGPGTNFSILGQLATSMTGLVLGRLPDNSWFQVNVNGVLGWVSATVVILGGNCAGVSIVQLPTAPPPPTATSPAPTDTGMPSATPTDTDTPAPAGTLHIHFPPITNITLIAPIQIVPVNPTLNYQANANYGEANLSAGFSPDPYSVGMTTGGGVDVSYLGGSCSGFATAAPDLRINFGGGGSSLLRIYFVGSNGDPAMVVNDPYGNFYCVDDSFGTVNPTIDFNNPAGGTYDVWIASYAANTNISGTLYLTENSGNHP